MPRPPVGLASIRLDVAFGTAAKPDRGARHGRLRGHFGAHDRVALRCEGPGRRLAIILPESGVCWA
eukprot:8639642-Lingulodinium_polyedra.AAC.1